MPTNPMARGADLSRVPYVFVALLGEFKGATGVKQHIICSPHVTQSGIQLRWWLEKVMAVRAEEGCRRGPAFGYRDGSVATLAEYDAILHEFLLELQEEEHSPISSSDDIFKLYGFFRSFRKAAEGRAQEAALDKTIMAAMNRWRIWELAHGQQPELGCIVEHYTDALSQLAQTWRYGYIQ